MSGNFHLFLGFGHRVCGLGFERLICEKKSAFLMVNPIIPA